MHHKNDIPDDNPSYALHGVAVQVIVYQIKLRFRQHC